MARDQHVEEFNNENGPNTLTPPTIYKVEETETFSKSESTDIAKLSFHLIDELLDAMIILLYSCYQAY